jgi:hypothetical protein
MPIPPKTVQKVKVASTPTTTNAAPATKVVNPTPATNIGTPVLTGGAAGYAGVGAVIGKADYTSSNSLTTQQVAVKPKTITTAPTVSKTTNRAKDYL